MKSQYISVSAPDNRVKIDFLTQGEVSAENPEVTVTVELDRSTGLLDIRVQVTESEGASQWKEKDFQLDTRALEL